MSECDGELQRVLVPLAVLIYREDLPGVNCGRILGSRSLG